MTDLLTPEDAYLEVLRIVTAGNVEPLDLIETVDPSLARILRRGQAVADWQMAAAVMVHIGELLNNGEVEPFVPHTDGAELPWHAGSDRTH